MFSAVCAKTAYATREPNKAIHQRIVGSSEVVSGEGLDWTTDHPLLFLAAPGHEHRTVCLIIPHLLVAVEFEDLALLVAGNQGVAIGQTRDGVGPLEVDGGAYLGAVLIVLNHALLIVVRHDDVTVRQNFHAAEQHRHGGDLERFVDLLGAAGFHARVGGVVAEVGDIGDVTGGEFASANDVVVGALEGPDDIFVAIDLNKAALHGDERVAVSQPLDVERVAAAGVHPLDIPLEIPFRDFAALVFGNRAPAGADYLGIDGVPGR